MSEIVLETRGITRDYHIGGGFFGKGSTVHALKGVDLKVEKGKTLAIVGESGCGKSTLARIMTMIDAPTSGELLIDGKPVEIGKKGVDPEMRRKVQIVFQNPYGSLNPRQKIGDVLMEPLIINEKVPAQERRERAMEMLLKVGLQAEHFNRYPHMFSGGQRQRIAIARALMLRPRLLVLDEPVSALDLSVQAQVLNLLADLQEEFGLTYVFISHDLSVIESVSDRVAVLYFGRLAELGASERIFSAPRHPYTHLLLKSAPVPGKRSLIPEDANTELPDPYDPPQGCAFFARCPRGTNRCKSEQPPLEAAPGHPGHMAACHHPVKENEDA